MEYDIPIILLGGSGGSRCEMVLAEGGRQVYIYKGHFGILRRVSRVIMAKYVVHARAQSKRVLYSVMDECDGVYVW